MIVVKEIYNKGVIMQFKISKSVFNATLSFVGRAIGVNSPLPELSGFKLEATENELIVIASDSEVSIKKSIQADKKENSLEIIEVGSVVLDARYLTEIVRKMDSDIVHFELLDGALTRIAGHLAQFNLNGMPAANYPAIDFSTPEKSITMASSDLHSLISQTLFATSDKETRPILTGINFNYDGETLIGVATDSFRLARKRLILDKVGEPFNITIPRKALNEITKVLEDEENITLAISNKKVQFLNDHNIIQSRLLEGIYPDTNRLIPEQFITTLKMNTREFLNAIDRASFIKSSEGIPIVRLNIDNEKVEISSRSQEVGSSLEELVPVSFEGEPLRLSFSGKYLMDAIRSLNSSEVLIQFSGDMRPTIITNEKDVTILQLVLPVRSYD